MNELMFVEIRNPNSLRKDILGTALDSTSLVKEFGNIKELKEKKLQIINELRNEMENIKKEMSNLEKRLPKIKEEKQKKEINLKLKEVNIEKKQVSNQKKVSEEDKLSDEIMNIENKLRSL